MAKTVVRMATTGPWAQRWAVRLSVLLVVAAVLVGVRTVLATHNTGEFELDGNALTGTDHDWDQVYSDSQADPPTNTSNAKAISFAADALLDGTESLQATIFTGGGSKDPQDIDQWAWKDGAGGLPDKDNLLHSFAARYSLPGTIPGGACPNGTGDLNGNGVIQAPEVPFNPNIPCEVLFFGSDRYANDGDAQQGFWFFQNEITLGTTPLGGGSAFNGVHKEGDLLVISDFSNGGEKSTISVFKWDPACTATNKPSGDCADANLRRLATSAAANCATASAGDAFCGIVNGGTETSPWPFLDKAGSASFRQGEFYEGGVNLSLLGLAGECFASVASETRSSTSTTAVLKDFVLGAFARCETGLVTTPKQADGTTNIPGTGLSIGGGSVQVRDSAELTISGVGDWQGTMKFYLCGPADLTPTQGVTQATCLAGGVQIGTDIAVDETTTIPVVSAAATVTSTGKYCWRGEFISGTAGVPNATDASAGECFTVIPVLPAIITSATAGPVPLGTALDDTATLSLTANQPGTPVINPTTAGAAAGGTITFSLYGPSATAVCNAQNLIATRTVTVNGNGPYLASNGTGSGSLTPTVAGTYYWIASYSGNPPNTSGPVAGGCGDSGEVSVVQPNTPGIITVASAAPPTGAPLGTAINDVATISGLAAPSNGVHGTITFNAYGPFNNTTTCTGTAVYTSTITISGNGSYNSANGSGGTFTPTVAGNYNWIASYQPGAGDVNNVAVSGQCGDANEGSLIKTLTPGVSTSQFFFPNDSATITVASGGGNLAGTVRFRVWTNNACTGTPVYDSGALNVATNGTGTGISRTIETNNTSGRVSVALNGNPINVYWQVDFVSTNPGHVSVPGTCGMERSTITVVDQPPSGGGGN